TTDATTKNALLQEMASRVINPYIVMAVILVLLALMIRKSSLPEIDMDGEESADSSVDDRKQSVLQYPHLVLGVLCLFLYVGVEVLAGDAIGIYGNELGIPLEETKYFTSFTLFAMLVGYVIGIFTIPKYVSQQKALSISAISGILFATGAFLSQGYVAISFIALLGLSNALMWPAIFPLAIHNLGRFTKIGSALLVMGIAGGALMPLLYTGLKDKAGISNHTSFYLCALPAYLYILYYALAGHKVGLKKVKKTKVKLEMV
ncbi:MAG: glucose/galactose MFS transporter, partial [Chitinophagaceae bacterium]